MFFKDQVRLVSPKIPQNKHQATHQSHSTCRCIQVFVKITLFWLEEKLEFLEKFRLRLLCNLNRLFFIVLAVGLMSSQKSIYCQCIGIRTPLFVLQREIQENHSKFTFDSRIFKISLRNIFTYHLALLFLQDNEDLQWILRIKNFPPRFASVVRVLWCSFEFGSLVSRSDI